MAAIDLERAAATLERMAQGAPFFVTVALCPPGSSGDTARQIAAIEAFPV